MIAACYLGLILYLLLGVWIIWKTVPWLPTDVEKKHLENLGSVPEFRNAGHGEQSCVAAPDLEANRQRAFDALVQTMVEHIEFWSYEECLAALNAADQIDQGRQAARSDEIVRAR